MIHKLIVGRHVNFPLNLNPGTLGPPDALTRLPGNFFFATNANFWIQESQSGGSFFRGTSHRVSDVVAGSNLAKPARDFRWLPYSPGKVTVIPYAGADVLTGDMSGCYIVDFTCSGTRYLAHIGTHLTKRTRLSVTVKAIWNAAIDSGAITVNNAVNVVHQSFTPSAGVIGAKWWAAIATSGDDKFYNLEVLPQRAPGECKIIGLTDMTPTGVTQLRFPDSETDSASINDDE